MTITERSGLQGRPEQRWQQPTRLVKAASLLLLPPLLAACGGNNENNIAPSDGYATRARLHELINPLNLDKYTTFEFADRTTQEQSRVDFHHLKSNPEKFERLITHINGQEFTVLEMQQENVPFVDVNLEFQHSTINLLNTTTGEEEVLQINRIKPAGEKAEPVTAYTLFLGADNPENLGTIIISDKEDHNGKKGEVFVSLKPDAKVFGYEQTSERNAEQYSHNAALVLNDLQQKEFDDPRVQQATWFVNDKDHVRTTKGILNGTPYTIVSKRFNNDVMVGYHAYGRNFDSAEILNQSGGVIARITTAHFDGDVVVFNFSTIEDGKEKTVLELKRSYQDKSEIQTSTGTGTTIGFTSNGQVTVGWTTVDLQTPVNYQNENTMLYSYGPRDTEISPEQEEENMQRVSGILVLMGGEDILDGLDFSDSENEWRQSSDAIIKEAKNKRLKADMGFWLELPIDATVTGQAYADAILQQGK